MENLSKNPLVFCEMKFSTPLVKKFSTSFIKNLYQGLKMTMSTSQFMVQMKYLSLQCKLCKKSTSRAKITAKSWSSSSFSYAEHLLDRGISFRGPGAFHHARWMTKVIYCLKMYLFPGEFTLTKEKKLGFGIFASFMPNFILKYGFNLQWLQKLLDWT